MSARDEALSRTLDLFCELLGADLREEINATLAVARVRLKVTPADLLTRQTQAAVYVLSSLLARSGITIEADIAAAPRLVDLPGLAGPDFGDALSAALPRLFPGAQLRPEVGEPDIVVAFGAADVPTGGGVVHIAVGVDGSTAWIRRRPGGRGEWRPADVLAALGAAGLAASEVHKDALRRVARQPLEVLEPQEPTFVVPIALACPIDVGSVEAVSAGAIIQNMLLVLAAEELISAELRLFDGDVMALSNANRCPFVLIDTLGKPKVDAVAELVPKRLHIHPMSRHLDDETADLISRGSTIVVGADDIAVRHRAQDLDPAWLAIGATSHFLALVTEHPAGEPCGGCAHGRLGEDIPIIPTVSIVSFWAGYLLALRLVARAAGSEYPPERRVTNFWALRPGAIVEHSLSYNPNCPLHQHRVPLDRAG